MQTEARVGVVVEGGGQRALASGHDAAVDGGVRRFSAAHHQRSRQQGLQQQPQIGTVAHLLAGGVAGAVSKTCTAPLARLTILFQVGYHFPPFLRCGFVAIFLLIISYTLKLLFFGAKPVLLKFPVKVLARTDSTY